MVECFIHTHGLSFFLYFVNYFLKVIYRSLSKIVSFGNKSVVHCMRKAVKYGFIFMFFFFFSFFIPIVFIFLNKRKKKKKLKEKRRLKVWTTFKIIFSVKCVFISFFSCFIIGRERDEMKWNIKVTL